MAPSSAPTWRVAYLTSYNAIFAALWSYVLFQVLANISSDRLNFFEKLEPLARWIQTLALLDVLHAATRLIPAPLGSTFTQVVTRVIQVWLIWYTFPTTTASSYGFPALLIAWSMADAVRYAYLALNLYGQAPAWLVWLRYSMFFVLYPIGIGAEWWLMYRAIQPAGNVSSVLPPVFYFLLALYVPGAYKMFVYMMKQRKKSLSKVKAKRIAD